MPASIPDTGAGGSPGPAPRSGWLLPVGFVLVLVAVLGPSVWERYLAPPGEAVTGVVEATCDLNAGPCSASFPGGASVALTVSPRPIPVVKPLDLVAAVSGAQPRKVVVDFAGERMNMGLNRVELVRQHDGSWTGSGMLPVCVTGKMGWIATVTAEVAGNKQLVGHIRFEAGGV